MTYCSILKKKKEKKKGNPREKVWSIRFYPNFFLLCFFHNEIFVLFFDFGKIIFVSSIRCN